MSRTFEDAKKSIRQIDPTTYVVDRGLVPNMRVPAKFYVDDALRALLFEEMQAHFETKGFGGFIPAVVQLANVAALPGIVKVWTHIIEAES